MSEIKVFRVEGSYTKDHLDYVFRKEKRALKKEDAVELVLSDITSIGIFRRQVKIGNIVELKKEQITDPLILQIIDS